MTAIPLTHIPAITAGQNAFQGITIDTPTARILVGIFVFVFIVGFMLQAMTR